MSTSLSKSIDVVEDLTKSSRKRRWWLRSFEKTTSLNAVLEGLPSQKSVGHCERRIGSSVWIEQSETLRVYSPLQNIQQPSDTATSNSQRASHVSALFSSFPQHQYWRSRSHSSSILGTKTETLAESNGVHAQDLSIRRRTDGPIIRRKGRTSKEHGGKLEDCKFGAGDWHMQNVRLFFCELPYIPMSCSDAPSNNESAEEVFDHGALMDRDDQRVQVYQTSSQSQDNLVSWTEPIMAKSLVRVPTLNNSVGLN